jgi:predicted nuclease of predicted toxin-antitoxin system
MNFLADMGVSMTTVTALRQVGHNVKHLREEGLMRLEDPKIVAKARSEGRIILTFDLDFSEIMALSNTTSPSVILFRMRNHTPQVVTPRLLLVIDDCQDELIAGAFVTVEDSGYRLRRLPIRGTSSL